MDKKLAEQWHNHLIENKYAYNFKWLGRHIFQEPQDIIAIQELIWKVKPDLIVETGIANGGSLLLSASILSLIPNCHPFVRNEVIGIDIDIRKESKDALINHPLAKYIRLLEGSSIDQDVISTISSVADRHNKIMVFLDSDHTHNHVLAELNAYAPLVTQGSYCVVFDTGIEDIPQELCFGRQWGKGNNPKTAVWEFLKSNNSFEMDKEIETRLMITSAPDGWLKRVK